jgi:hypothetical protein
LFTLTICRRSVRVIPFNLSRILLGTSGLLLFF